MLKNNSYVGQDLSFEVRKQKLRISNSEETICKVPLSKELNPKGFHRDFPQFLNSTFGISVTDNQVSIMRYLLIDFGQDPSCLNYMDYEEQKFLSNFCNKIHNYDITVDSVKEELKNLMASLQETDQTIFENYDSQKITFNEFCTFCLRFSDLYQLQYQ